jgi:hypothetical protein
VPLTRIRGERAHLERRAVDSGSVDIGGARVRWWILDDDSTGRRREAQEWLSTGHVAAVWLGELADVLPPVRGGYSRLNTFGIRFGYERVVLWVEPTVAPTVPSEAKIKRALAARAAKGASPSDLAELDMTLRAGVPRVTPNLTRTALLLDHGPLPWAEWAARFAEVLPEPLRQLQERVARDTTQRDLSGEIVSRLLDHWQFLRIPPYVAPRGPRTSSSGVPDVPAAGRGREDPPRTAVVAPVVHVNQDLDGRVDDAVPAQFDAPDVAWVTSRDGSRAPGDIEDRAARYDSSGRVLTINADFRVFQAIVAFWGWQHPAPGAGAIIEDAVREWYQTALVEVVVAAHALTSGGSWDEHAIATLLSPEALTAAILPRLASHQLLKKTLTQRLGPPAAPVAARPPTAPARATP